MYTAPRLIARTYPTEHQLAALTPMERTSFWLADVAARHFGIAATVYNSIVMHGLLLACSARRMTVHGAERVAHLKKKDRILIVANHRSFFDFFVVMRAMFEKTNFSRRIFFPVRGNFFYDHPLGPILNATMSGMRMFPPIMRAGKKRHFNLYSVQRATEELSRPGTVMGVHPEGTRGKGSDPYELLPAQSGVGKIALAVDDLHIVPVFLLGIGNALHKEFWWNLFSPSAHRIHVVFGSEVDVSDLRADRNKPIAHKRAAERCLDGIRVIGDEHRRIVGDLTATTGSRETEA